MGVDVVDEVDGVDGGGKDEERGARSEGGNVGRFGHVVSLGPRFPFRALRYASCRGDDMAGGQSVRF